MTDTSALRAFVEARLDEDKTAAIIRGESWSIEAHESSDPSAIASGVWVVTGPDGERGVAMVNGSYRADHIARHDPARVLREVAAKRALLAAVDSMRHYAVDEDGYGSCAAIVAYEELRGDCDCNLPARQLQILRPLASVWSDHPDYRQDRAP